MARKPRIHLPGGVYHVMVRGNGGQDIFLSSDDRCHFLLLLQEGVVRFGHRIHAFCLMTNHVHLAVQVADIPLSRIMQNLSFRYTRWFNRRQRRTGHLFQGRYKAVLVDRDAYLLELVRYIHLNPVRAGMVKEAGDYEWSGHRACVGLDTLPWFTVDYVLGQLADNVARARRRYAAFVRDGAEDGYRQEFHQGGEDSRLLGDDRFMEDALAHLPTPHVLAPDLDTIIRCVCDRYGVEEAELAAKGRMRRPAEVRAVTGWLAAELNSASLSEVANRFGRDIATLSGAVRGVREQMRKDNDFSGHLNSLREIALHTTVNPSG